MRAEGLTQLDAARLIVDHQAGLWRYLRFLGCDPSLADDLTQETFLAVLRGSFSEIGPQATSAYLRKVARNLVMSYRRKNRRSAPLENAVLDEVDAVWARWERNDGGEALIEALESCLETLSERARRALDLRFKDDLSRGEIAGALGLTEDGAKNLIQRAKQQLRECVSRKLP
jgi:RNA polymerase sigma-70 factor (ECF subfamily)